MKSPLWALAAGCVPDAMPWDIPRIAAAAGFQSSGMWVDPKTTWDAGALQKTQDALKETGITLIDVEVIWLEATENASDRHRLIVDVGLALAARNVLVVSRHPDYQASLRQFQDLCERAGEGIRVCLEFGEFTEIKSLQAANAFINAVNHPAAGVLVDLMHLNRAGEPMPDLNDPRFPYVQGCDYWQASSTMTGSDYIRAAVDERCCLGEGQMRSADLVALGNGKTDVSLEIRSRALREAFPDPFIRGQQIFDRCLPFGPFDQQSPE
ncbi:MAG: TIM barrel protein [Proteobacteria bacterium]|jgi:sugar phosphate isomerase/epimerase|nr:TIM barrel protein [Pseudomonadota bacterium]